MREDRRAVNFYLGEYLEEYLGERHWWKTERRKAIIRRNEGGFTRLPWDRMDDGKDRIKS